MSPRVMTAVLVLVCSCWLLPSASAGAPLSEPTAPAATTRVPEHTNLSSSEEDEKGPEPCVCGVFMSGQLNRTRGRGRRQRLAPRGFPVLQYDSQEPCLPCGAAGYKHCINRCLDEIIKHLPKSAPLVCSALDRDCHRERAYLFVRNCDSSWFNTNFSAGKPFCCRSGEPVSCSDV